MAAVSAPQAVSALTPPSSSHGGHSQNSSWKFSVPARTEDSLSKQPTDYTTSNRLPFSHSNGYSNSQSNSRPGVPHRDSDSSTRSRPQDSALLAAPARLNALNRQESNISDTGSAPDSLLELYGQSSAEYGEKKMANGLQAGDEEDPERSRWIHRDKLARIESQELQAAGIILPRARGQSKSSRRGDSRDPNSAGIRSEQSEPRRQRVGSFPTEEEEESENNVWDLRLPEEVAEAQPYRDISGGVKGVSRIPVNKKSAIPIPLQHLEREAPLKRVSGGQVDENELAYPKSRGRSQSIKVLEDYTATPPTGKRLASEHSPTKKGPPAKKAASQPRAAAGSNAKPKVRSASNTTSSQRPTTRSGDLGHIAHSNSISKRPEGDPPWLATMYKPDPRLPPDQQLLPTVAKRLQQEQWEKEGKFGNTYDTDFRPLNDEQPQSPSPPTTKTSPEPEMVEEKEPESTRPLSTLNTNTSNSKNSPEWPLRGGPKSPALSTGRPGTAGGGSYTVMPRITTPQLAPQILPPKPVNRMPDAPEETKEKGCCCAVM